MPYKDKEKNKEYQRGYQRKWRLENQDRVKEINKKSESRLERIEYLKKWKRENPEKVEESKNKFKENNPDKIKEYFKKYNKTENGRNRSKKYYCSVKGTINFLKKRERQKFNIENENIDVELIKYIEKRDKVCCYCGMKFTFRSEFDHINSFKPLSKNNIAKVCSVCNQSKSNADLLQWMKWKNYEITEKILYLYNSAYS